jgi:ribonuclease D
MKFTYIENQTILDDLVFRLKESEIIALDTEFTHRTTYFPILSTIQIAILNKQGGKDLFIVDCQIGLNLDGFYQIMADEKIMKIFHSAKQDLQIFYTQSNLKPKNIVDTQIMANFCNIGFNIGYGNLVENLLEIKLDKFEQNSNWQKRPLSANQIKYALLDVEYLHQIYGLIKEKLIAKNRYSWFLEDMQNFLVKIFDDSGENLFKSFFFKNKTASEIFVIKKLILFREEQAKKLDIPRQHFLRDEAFERIVVEKKISAKFSSEVKEKILEILNSAIQVENEAKTTKTHAQIIANKASFLKAKDFINKISNQLDLKSQILLTTPELKMIIDNEDNFRQKISGWRFTLLGEELKKIVTITDLR